MENIVDILFKMMALVEAEVADIQKRASRMLQALALLSLAVLLAFMGFILVIYGVFLGLSLFMPPFMAAFAAGALTLLMGGGFLQCAKKKMS